MVSVLPAYKASLESFCDALESPHSDHPGTDELAVYRNNILGVHSSALGSIFPTISGKLGDDIFTALARVYSRHYPASEWDINQFGSEFAAFLLAQQSSAKAHAFSWAELARLASIEYAITRSYYAHPGDASFEFVLDSSETDWMSTTVNGFNVNLLAENHPYLRIPVNCHLNRALLIAQRDLLVEISNVEKSEKRT